MTTQQPEALRLADIVERLNVGVHSQAIAEEYYAVRKKQSPQPKQVRL